MNLILLIAVLVFFYLLIRFILQRAPRYGRPFLVRLGLVVAAIATFALAISGRLHWLFALLSGLLPFIGRVLSFLAPLLRFLPVFQSRGSQAGNPSRSTGQNSKVRSTMLEMMLDHDSGEISGKVLDGGFNGRTLASLERAELRTLLNECALKDPEGARLLQAYIEHHYGEQWQTHPPTTDTADGAMTKEEALAILGLNPDASHEEILAAHKRLMSRLHPDKGGSNYLASKINQAKSLLVKNFS